jgi:beta-carotene ketolase (CrtO type)
VASLKWKTHSPLDLERKLASAVRGTIGHSAMLPYQTGSMRPSSGNGSLLFLGGKRLSVWIRESSAAWRVDSAGRNAAQAIYSDLNLDFQEIIAART